MNTNLDDPIEIQQKLNYDSNLNEAPTLQNEEENKRFTKYSALTTLLIMAIGPSSLLFQAVGEMIDMLMITKRYKNEPNSHAIEMIGFTGQILSFPIYLGLFFGQAICSRVSSLIGSGDRESASHIISDTVYICILFSFIFVSIFVFLMKPLLTFLGTPNSMLNPTFKFLIPIYVAIPITILVYICQYYLQSIGNSILSGLVKVIVYVLQLGILYRGVFSLKLKFSDIFSKFNPEIKKAIFSALPLLLTYLVFSLPQILILQTLTSAAKNYAQEIGGVFAVYTKLFTIVNEIPTVISQSFLSTGAHAWGSNNPKRLIHLVLCAAALSFSLTLLASFLIIFKKSMICKAFLDVEMEIKLAEKMIPIPFYTAPIIGISMTISFLMIVIGKPIFSFIPLIIRVVVLCGGCKLIAKKSKGNVTRVMYIYNITDISLLIVDLILLFIPIRDIRRKMKEESSKTIVNDYLLQPKAFD